MVGGDGDRPHESTSLLSHRFSKQRTNHRQLSSPYADDVEAGSIHSYGSDVSSHLSKAKPALGAKPAGKQLAVNDLVNIAGFHDLWRDSSHLRSLYSSNGPRARIFQAWDATSGWIAVALMGALTACIAFLVDVSVVTVSDWKMGHCSTGLWKSRKTCCASPEPSTIVFGLFPWRTYRASGGDFSVSNSSAIIASQLSIDEACGDWIYWSNEHVGQYASYVGFALVFGVISGLVTLLTKSSLPAVPVKRQVDVKTLYRDETGTSEGNNGHAPEISEAGHRPEGNDDSSPSQSNVIYLAAGSGIPEIKTIISGFDIPNHLSLKVLLVKAVGSIFAVSTGMCLGKEGPFVHISTCIANLVGGLLPKYRQSGRKMRECLSAGCSAGLCVAFGAPIGGVLFSLEEICTQFPRKVLCRAFLCSLVAAAVLKYLNPTGTGKLVLFETKYGTDYETHHYLIFIILGVAGGIFGGTFCRLNFLWSRFFRSFTIIKGYPVFEVALITLATALLQYPNVVLREPGDVIIENLLVDCRRAEKATAWACTHENGDESNRLVYLAWLVYGMLIKLILTTITFGIKVPSGIIIPALNAGAFFGRLVGQSAAVAGTLNPGIFAMVGGVAFLAGVCRMTVSLAVIMFELTGEAEYIIPNMIGILIAKWVADAIEPEGVYDLAQTLSGHPFLDGDTALKITQQESGLVDELVPFRQDMGEILVEVPSSGLLDIQLIRDRLDILTRRNRVRNPGLVLVRDGAIMGYMTETEFEFGLQSSGAAVPSGKTCRVAVRVLNELASELVSEPEEGINLIPFVNGTPLTIPRGAPMECAVEMFSKLGLAYLLVVDGVAGPLCGVITKKNLLDWLRERKHE